jgi:hypothetical protein
MKRMLKALGLLLAVLMVLVGGALAWSWAPDRPVDTLKARWAPPPSTFITVEGM